MPSSVEPRLSSARDSRERALSASLCPGRYSRRAEFTSRIAAQMIPRQRRPYRHRLRPLTPSRAPRPGMRYTDTLYVAVGDDEDFP